MKKIFLFLVVLLLSVSCTIQKTTSKKYIDDAYYTPQTDVNENQIDSLYDNEYVDDNFTNYSFFINPYQYTYSYYDLYYSSYYSPWNFGINFGYYSYNYYPYLIGIIIIGIIIIGIIIKIGVNTIRKIIMSKEELLEK